MKNIVKGFEFTVIKIIDKNKNICKDFLLNICASLIFTFATQLLVYPYISRIMTNAEYGMVLTIMGIVNAVAVSLGNPLNNARILLQPQYDEKQLNGDYNLLFIGCILIDTIVVSILCTFILKRNLLTIIGCTVISIFILFRGYYSASYRIVIDYRKNLYSCLFGLFGYIVGIGITYVTGAWIFTFLFGELFACAYIFFTATIIHDKFQVTTLFSASLKKYSFIMFAATFSTMMTYMDRFFIYPILGAEQVSVYNVASFLGKTAGIVMNPIAGVLLTYYAKKNRLTLSQFYKGVGIFSGVSIVFYILILLIGIPITRIFYPNIIKSVVPIFAIANLATTLFILGNTVQPTLLRFCSEKWQPVIQTFYFSTYLILGFIGMKLNGIIGFCYAVLISNVVRITMMMIITTITLHNEKKGGKNE